MFCTFAWNQPQFFSLKNVITNVFVWFGFRLIVLSFFSYVVSVQTCISIRNERKKSRWWSWRWRWRWWTLFGFNQNTVVNYFAWWITGKFVLLFLFKMMCNFFFLQFVEQMKHIIISGYSMTPTHRPEIYFRRCKFVFSPKWCKIILLVYHKIPTMGNSGMIYWRNGRSDSHLALIDPLEGENKPFATLVNDKH